MSEPTLPDPRDFIDPARDPEARQLVAEYLRCGRRLRFFMGVSRCRLCGCVNGSEEQTDEVFLWPEGLAHYVEEHAVRPPAELVAHILARLDADDAVEVDRTWWSRQEGTGTARHWTRWRFDVGPCAAERAAELARLLRQYPGAALDESALARGEVVSVHLCEPTLAQDLRRDLKDQRVPFVCTEEAVPVPDSLLG